MKKNTLKDLLGSLGGFRLVGEELERNDEDGNTDKLVSPKEGKVYQIYFCDFDCKLKERKAVFIGVGEDNLGRGLVYKFLSVGDHKYGTQPWIYSTKECRHHKRNGESSGLRYRGIGVQMEQKIEKDEERKYAREILKKAKLIK